MKSSRNVKGVEEWSKAGTFLRKPEKGWLHSAQNIKDGVSYALKYLGCIEVLKSMRTLHYDVRQQVTKEAMYRCCEANGYKFSRRKKAKSNILKLLADYPRTAHSDTFISLTVSTSGILLTNMSNGEMISKHDIQGISFTSGAEKDIPDIVGYVAKDAVNRRACHVLDCPQNLSFDVVTTIGQAFELHYKMFLENPPEILPVPKSLPGVDTDLELLCHHYKAIGKLGNVTSRFEGTIFGCEDQQAAAIFESSDQTYERPNDEDDDTDDDYTEPDEKHEYTKPVREPRPIGEPRPSLLDEDTEHYQTPPRSILCEMSHYDTPHGSLKTHSGGEKTTLTDFTFGTQSEGVATEAPVNMPSHDPVASGPPDEDLLISFDPPPTTGQVSNGAPFNVNWETFDDDDDAIASSDQPQSTAECPTPMPRKLLPEPAIPEKADSPRHNSLGYALPFYKKPEEQATKRTPPPLPKPYASKNANRAGTPPTEPTKSVETPSSDSDNELFLKDWFHGQMSRQDAENLLVRDGDFLVRESTTNPGQYVLTGLQNGYPKHLLLIDPAGMVRTKNHSFQSVDHLVCFHRDNGIPIVSSGSAILLIQPVVKDSQPYDMPFNMT